MVTQGLGLQPKNLGGWCPIQSTALSFKTGQEPAGRASRPWQEWEFSQCKTSVVCSDLQIFIAIPLAAMWRIEQEQEGEVRADARRLVRMLFG